MEVQTIQVEDIKTLENLTSAVEYYRAIQEEISRLQASKDIAKESILAHFRATGMRHFDTPSRLRARTYTRLGNKWIDTKEAAVLLDPDTFNKLLKVGETIVVLSVRPVKSGEEDAD